MFEDVDWTHGQGHMSDKHGVTVDQANEAPLRDPNRAVIHPDYASQSGQSTRIIGYSHTFDAVLTIIALTHEGAEDGVNGWKANEKDRSIYYEQP